MPVFGLVCSTFGAGRRGIKAVNHRKGTLIFKDGAAPFMLRLCRPARDPKTMTMKQNKNPNRLKPLRASKPTPELFQLPPLGMDDEALALDIRRYFGNFLGRDKYCRSSHYPYQALVLALRDRLMERWKRTRYAYEERGAKHAYYLSLEFLMGRTLGNAMLNLGLGRGHRSGAAPARPGAGGADRQRARRRPRQRRPRAGWRPASSTAAPPCNCR